MICAPARIFHPIMEDQLNRNLFFVREHPGLFKAASNYDILDPATGLVLLECREEDMSRLVRILRFTDLKRTTPFKIVVMTPDGKTVLRITRGIPIVASVVHVLDDAGIPVGSFRQKAFSVSGAFDVLDAQGNQACRLKGGRAGWTFSFATPDGVELARVNRKWAGLGKELFTGANDYMLEIDEAVPPDSVMRRLVLA